MQGIISTVDIFVHRSAKGYKRVAAFFVHPTTNIFQQAFQVFIFIQGGNETRHPFKSELVDSLPPDMSGTVQRINPEKPL